MSYYQIVDETQNNDKDKVSFNIFFDKDKLHSLFSNKNISYSDISDKELYLLPVILKKTKFLFIIIIIFTIIGIKYINLN